MKAMIGLPMAGKTDEEIKEKIGKSTTIMEKYGY